MRFALKEWSTTSEALGKGLITCIWRKGGINDNPSVKKPDESFSVLQNQFLLFPTFTHQEFEKIKKNYINLFDPSLKTNKDNQIKIKYWAQIIDEIQIEKLEHLLTISSELVNSNEYLENSWNQNPEHKGKILILRVYILENPVLIPDSHEYSGCRSWIELKIDIPKTGSKPVLQFKDFNRKTRLIKLLLEGSKVEKTIARV